MASKRYFILFILGLVAFIAGMSLLEQQGVSHRWLGLGFLTLPLVAYSVIGIFNRATSIADYYVASRRIPAFFNGMAVSAEWLSAASFIGLAGTLYLGGFQGLAYILGWTGGFVLVALLLAPYLRRFGQFTIPDFLEARYGGTWPRLLGVITTVLASFVYLVAQIYGIGLITTRVTGLQFEIGVFVGLTGILVCSLLGGMRAVTWTQVAQYIIRIVAYLTPVVILSYKLTGVPLPNLAYGEVLERVAVLEEQIWADPAEQAVRATYLQRAEAIRNKIEHLPESLAEEQHSIGERIAQLKASDAPLTDLVILERERKALPANPAQAREVWTNQMQSAQAKANPPVRHTEAFPGRDASERDVQRLNFLALVFCLTIGTASLPHILTRFYTTPSVHESRSSVAWALFFIALLYLAAPAYAVFTKFELYDHLVNTPIANLPGWISAWGRLGLVSIEDVNQDGLLQLAELSLSPDVIVLATPEIAGMPFVVVGLVATGGFASALSAADGLLLTMAGTISHDFFYRIVRPQASPQVRLVTSKIILLMVAALAATVAAERPASILPTVAWAFSIAASAFFPPLVLGVFWERANRTGVIAGMLVGLLVTGYYLLRVEWQHLPWFGIQSTSAGVFGVPAAFLTIIAVSLLTAPPDQASRKFVKRVRVTE